MVTGDAYNIPHMLWILGDQLVLYVPVGLLYHVGEENSLDLVHEEDLGDGLEHFIDGEAEGNIAASRNRAEDGYNWP